MPHIEDFDDWFAAEYPRVVGAVTIVCGGDLARAEDATADAFLRALERWDRVRDMDAPAGWVTRVAVNRAKRSFRWRPRSAGFVDSTLHSPAAEPQPEDTEVWDAVRSLTLRQRTALVLRYVADQTQAEVARHLDVADGTAAATLHQARQRVRLELEADQ